MNLAVARGPAVLGGVDGLAFDTQATALHDPLLSGHVVAELLVVPTVFRKKPCIFRKSGVGITKPWEWTYVYCLGENVTMQYLEYQSNTRKFTIK